MATITLTLFWDLDLREWTTTLGGTTKQGPIRGLVQGDIVKFNVKFVQSGAAVTLTSPSFTTSGIKAENDFSGDYFIALDAPTGSPPLYTFTVDPLNSAELAAFLLTYRNTWCALEIRDSVNGIVTTPLELQITPGYSLGGTPPDPANPEFMRANATTHVLTSPTAAQFYAANPPTGGSFTTSDLVYVDTAGDDGTGERNNPAKPFLTGLAAKTAAISGDTVSFRPGTYSAYGLAKTGVNYAAEVGTLFSHTTTDSTHALFSDVGGAIVSQISVGDCHLDIASGAVTEGMIVRCENASSYFQFTGGKITIPQGGSGGAATCFGCFAGKLHVEVESIDSFIPTWWVNGDFFLRAKTIASTSYEPVYADLVHNATMTGKFWVSANKISNTGGACVKSFSSTGGTISTAQIWVDAQELEGSGGVAYISLGKVYIRAMKLTNTALMTWAINAGGGESWVTTQKIQGGILSVPTGSTGKVHLSTDDWQDSLGNTTDAAIIIDGGTNIVHVGGMTAVTTPYAVVMISGVLRLSAGTLDFTAIAAGNPVVLVGGTLTFEGNPRLLAASGQYSILADGSPVTVYGHFVTNTPIDPNVTAADGYTLDDGAGNVTEFLPAIVKAGGLVVPTISSTNTLTNKSISGSTNTLTNIPLGSVTGTLAIANGGTSATTATAARTALGLGTANSPAFTGLVLNGVSVTVGATSSGVSISKDFSANGNVAMVGDIVIGAGLQTVGLLNVAGPADTTITGGGTLALGGYTLTVPATGTAALLGTANTFTQTQTIPSMIGGASNMTITSGTGNSRTLTLQTTTSGGTATNALTINASQVVSIPGTTISTSALTGALLVAGGIGCNETISASNRIQSAYFSDLTNTSAYMQTATDTTHAWTLVNRTSTKVALTITGAASQSANLLNITDATPTVVFSVSAAGNVSSSGTLAVTGDVSFSKTITAAGTTGAQTINKTTGAVNFAAAATSLVVTNSLVTVNSVIHVQLATNDATAVLGAVVAAAGSFTIYMKTAPTAESRVYFTVTN